MVEIFTLLVTIIGVLITAILKRKELLSLLHNLKKVNSDIISQPNNDNCNLEVLGKILLNNFWSYPDRGGVYASWSVKESKVLCGLYEEATKMPGLGISIFSVELACKAFTGEYDQKVSHLLSWVNQNIQNYPPYYMLVESWDEITGFPRGKIPDFRHTVALAVILSRVHPSDNRLNSYLKLVLDKQSEDGHWSEDGIKNSAEMYTVLYSIEFLALARHNIHIDKEYKRVASDSVTLALEWLFDSRTEENLFSGMPLTKDWEPLISSAWVIRRLSSIKMYIDQKWLDRLSATVSSILECLHHTDAMLGLSEYHKFVIQTRIASALTVYMQADLLEGVLYDKVKTYLRDWKKIVKSICNKINDRKMLELNISSCEDIDLATSIFLIDSVLEPSSQKKYAIEILKL